MSSKPPTGNLAAGTRTRPAIPPAPEPIFVHLTREERVARGLAARETAPRSSHGKWEPAADRRDAIALLEEQAQSRVPELVPIRYGRMLVSPLAFYRGAAAIMAADLAATPRSGITVQLCGDAHLSNFGVFGTPERQLIFDINDFDETLPGPWEWDVKRLAASFEILGRERGFSAADRRTIVMAGVREYRTVIRQSATVPVLAAWYTHTKAEDVMAWVRAERRAENLDKKAVKAAAKDIARARTRDSMRLFAKKAGEVGGSLRIRPDPPLVVPIDDLAPPGFERDDVHGFMEGLVQTYRGSLAHQRHPIEAYRYVDTARKVVGVGSVGTRAWIHLFVGANHRDPLFLQAKEAQPSVLERYAGKSAYANQGKRVVMGQRLMQAASDIFLGWLRIRGLDGRPHDYYVRQLHDWKGSAEHLDIMRVPAATLYARLCGATLARAHARWGDRVAIASYLGTSDKFDRSVAMFAALYADQNERDYQSLVSAVNSGRLTAQTGL